MSVIQKVKGFFNEVFMEMQKVTWSNRDELMGSTTVILLTIFFMTLFIGFADILFSRFLDILLKA